MLMSHKSANEPGPNDEPGPKYVSYGSSFGNLGPPRESIFGPPPVQFPQLHSDCNGTDNCCVLGHDNWYARSCCKYCPPSRVSVDVTSQCCRKRAYISMSYAIC